MEDVQPDTIDSTTGTQQAAMLVPAPFRGLSAEMNVDVQAKDELSRRNRRASQKHQDNIALAQEFYGDDIAVLSDGSDGSMEWRIPARALHILKELPEKALSALSINTVAGLNLDTRQLEVRHYLLDDPDWLESVLHQGDFPGFRVVSVEPTSARFDAGFLELEERVSLMAVIRRNLHKLLAPYVIAVYASGVLSAQGQHIHVPCIRVMVRAKGFLPLGSWVMPVEIEGVPVDIVEGRPLDQQYNDYGATIPSDPNTVYSGTAIKVDLPTGASGGTFGAVVSMPGSTAQFGLTCAHVLSSEDLRAANLDVFRAGPNQRDPIGTTSTRLRKGFIRASAKYTGYVDCGTLSLDTTRLHCSTQLNPELRAAWEKSMVLPFPVLEGCADGRTLTSGTPLYKHGAKTGITMGKLATEGFVQNHPVCVKCVSPYTRETSRCPVAWLEGLFVQASDDESFTQSGDSGALVFMAEPRHPGAESSIGLVVGMHAVGNRDVSLACFINDVKTAVGFADILF